MATRYQKFIGGLLGEDVEGMGDEERKKLSRQGTTSAILGLLSGSGLLGGLGAYGQQRAAKREKESLLQRQQAAEQEMGRITGRLFGGAPAAPEGMGADETGLGPVAIRSQYRQNPQEALARMYGTQAGRDVAAGAPGLLKLAEESATGRTVGGAVYNPLTGQFSKPPTEKAKRLTPAEIAQERLPPGTVAEYNEKGELKIIYEPKIAGAGKEPGGGETYEGLRKEWTGVTKDYQQIGRMWAKVREAGTNPTTANDIALIFGYMKILDPSSVVREGEFATAQNAGSIPDSVRARYNQLIEGKGRLTPEQRQVFVQSAYGTVKSQIPGLDALREDYTNIARAGKLDPARVVIDPFKNVLLPKVSSENDPEYKKLANGSLYEAPDGTIRRKGGGK